MIAREHVSGVPTAILRYRASVRMGFHPVVPQRQLGGVQFLVEGRAPRKRRVRK